MLGEVHRAFALLTAEAGGEANSVALHMFIDCVMTKPSVWLPRREQIAHWYLGEAAPHMKRG